jgi:hypothetical protein
MGEEGGGGINDLLMAHPELLVILAILEHLHHLFFLN